MGLYIRIMPGKQFDPDDYLYKNNRIYNIAMPMAFEYREIKYLMMYMNAETWRVYCVLRYYEHIKFERVTPTLEEIYKEWLSEVIDFDTFMVCIKELQDLIIKDEALDTIQPVLKFERGGEWNVE